MLSFLQAIFLAILQGISELFPVSSLGHTVVIPAVLRWHIQQDSHQYLAFVVMLHLGSVIALITIFYSEWVSIVKGLMASVKARKILDEEYAHLAWLIIIGTLPVVVLGFLLEKKVNGWFGTPMLAAAFLVINGFLLLFGETLKKNMGSRELKGLKDLSFGQALIIGIFQSAALIPGISRSGASMVGGLIQGLTHEDSAHFAFLLATPAILGATVLETRYLASLQGVAVALLGALLAGICSYLSTKFLLKYFRAGTLLPFVYYCWIAGILSLFILKFFGG